MALTTTTVTGIIDLPNGVTPVAARVIFELTGWAKEGENIFVSGPVEVAVEPDGSFSVSLQTTEDLPVNYQVAVGYRIPSLSKDVITRLGLIAVPALGPVVLGDLLTIPAPVPSVPDALAQALAAAAQAIAAAESTAPVLEDREAAEAAAEAAAIYAGNASGAAGTAAADAAAAANALITPSVAAAEAARIAAEAARDANWDAGVIKYWPADAAAMAAITDMVTGDLAFRRSPTPERIFRYSGTAWVDQGEAPSAVKADRSEVHQLGFTGGELLASAGGSRTLAGGAIATPGTVRGITVPTGQTGAGSFMQVGYVIPEKWRAGTRVRLIYRLPTSTVFTRTTGFTFQVNTGTLVNRSSSVSSQKITNTGETLFVLDYTIQGDEIDIRPYFSIGGTAAAQEETIDLTSFRVIILSTASPALSAGEINSEYREAALRSEIMSSIEGDYLFGIGNTRSPSAWAPQYQGGAVAVAPYTVKIPAGQTGAGSILQTRWNVRPEVGRKVRLAVVFEVSANFTRTLSNGTFQVWLAAGGSANRPATITRETVGNKRVYTYEYTLQGDESILMPYVSTGGSAAATDETITFTDIVPYFLSKHSEVYSRLDDALSARIAFADKEEAAALRTIAYVGIPAAIPDLAVVVAPSGGDFTGPGAALSAITDATAKRRYEVRVRPGVYQEPEWSDKDYVDVVGVGREVSIVHFEQANNTSATNLSLYSAMYMRRTSRLEGLTIRAKNARYAIHLESSGLAPNRIQEIINCYIEHLGNQDAVNNTWLSQNGIGSGLSSGQIVRLRDSTIISRNAVAFSYHTNGGFTAPTLVEAKNCSFISHAPVQNAAAIVLIPIGSGQPDRCVLEGCEIGGDIQYQISPWIPTALADQPANHAEIHLTGHGNTPAVFLNMDWGEALRIDSATTGSTSSVTITGNAVASIFGNGTIDRHFSRKGSPGFSASVWGWGDVSTQMVGPSVNVLNKTLGQRLGDCSTTAKALTVTVDGTPITVTFDQNHTAQSNATVLGIINAALGAAATASTWKPGARYRPHFSDEEQSLLNTSGSGVPFGTVLAWDGSMQRVRPMTSADSADLFAGVAWEDIETGKRGRVKTSGWLPLADVRRADGAAVTFGTTFSISAAAPGTVVVGGSQGLLRAIRSDAVQVRPK